MPINKNTTALSAIYKGSSLVTKAYLGTDQIYPNTPPSYEVDYLVVAGGAGAGPVNRSVGYGSGGGGAGGLLYATNYELTISTEYTITVGAGGADPGGSVAYNGSPSTFGVISAIGGGHGGAGGTDSNVSADSGGSGGGGGNPERTAGAAGTPGQGYNGADASGTNGGGGGGSSAAAVGQAAGAGTSLSITGSSFTYAVGGKGGGDGSASSGGANTGTGGEGGRSQLYDGGAGGSGVVILRMPTANYSGTTTGSPTVTTDGTDTILTYTGSGTYTA